MWVDCKDCIYFQEGDCDECEGRDGCYFGETEQEGSYIVQTKIQLSQSQVESIIGSTDIGVLDCSNMTNEELDEIVDKLNSIGCTSFNRLSLIE